MNATLMYSFICMHMSEDKGQHLQQVTWKWKNEFGT